jgi:hypothetical protein
MRELARVADHAIIADQLVIVPRTIIRDRMWRTGIVPAGTQLRLIAMR